MRISLITFAGSTPVRRMSRPWNFFEKRGKDEAQKSKAHVTFGTAATTKVVFGLFSLFAMASNLTMPSHRINKDATFTENCMNRFHEINELYDGTMNEIHNMMYHTDISSNECFTFKQKIVTNIPMNVNLV